MLGQLTNLRLLDASVWVRETWPDTTAVRAMLHNPTGPDLVPATLTDEGMVAARARVERTALLAADTTFAPRPARHASAARVSLAGLGRGLVWSVPRLAQLRREG